MNTQDVNLITTEDIKIFAVIMAQLYYYVYVMKCVIYIIIYFMNTIERIKYYLPIY